MASQRPSFLKREREMKLKDKARQKAERRLAKKGNKPGGPPIDPLPGEAPPADDDAAAIDDTPETPETTDPPAQP